MDLLVRQIVDAISMEVLENYRDDYDGEVDLETKADMLSRSSADLVLFVANTLLGFIVGSFACLDVLNRGSWRIVYGILVWLAISIAVHSLPSIGDAKKAGRHLHSLEIPATVKIICTPFVFMTLLGSVGAATWLKFFYGVFIGFGLPYILL